MDEKEREAPPLIIGREPTPYSEKEIVQSIRWHILQGVHLCELYADAAQAAKNVRLEAFLRDLRDKHEMMSKESGRAWFDGLTSAYYPRF